MIDRLISWPLRKWRNRGFGIHSPFAFGMITRCLNEKEEYYRYEDLRKAAGSEREFRYASLIFRLVCRMTPKMAIFADSSVRNICVKAVKMADTRIVCDNDIHNGIKFVDNKAGKIKTIAIFSGSNREADDTLASKLLFCYQNLPSTSAEVTLTIVIPQPYAARGKSILVSLSTIANRSQQFISPRAAIICYPHPTPEKHMLTF